MIFMKRKQFEEEVSRRVGKIMEDERVRRSMGDMDERIWKLQNRVDWLERHVRSMYGEPSNAKPAPGITTCCGDENLSPIPMG